MFSQNEENNHNNYFYQFKGYPISSLPTVNGIVRKCYKLTTHDFPDLKLTSLLLSWMTTQHLKATE